MTSQAPEMFFLMIADNFFVAIFNLSKNNNNMSTRF